MISYTLDGCGNGTVTSITITSDLIDAWTVQNPSFSHTLEIEITVTCGTTYTITQASVDIPGQQLVVTPAMIGMSGSINDCVLAVVITMTHNITGDYQTEEKCIINDCQLKCCMASYTADNLSTDVVAYYLAMTWAADCHDCGCDDACVLYNKILEIVNNGSSNTCGCT